MSSATARFKIRRPLQAQPMRSGLKSEGSRLPIGDGLAMPRSGKTTTPASRETRGFEIVASPSLAAKRWPQLLATLAGVLVLLALAAAFIECHYIKRTQYHEQGVHGPKSYKFGYTSGDHQNPQERHEVSDYAGHVRGWYSYLDPHGKLVVTHYEADPKRGFRILNHKKAHNNGKRHYNS